MLGLAERTEGLMETDAEAVFIAEAPSRGGANVVALPVKVAPMTMDRFLAEVEKRAFQMAVLATSNPDDALDLVQEAMLKLVKRYQKRPAEEWKPLFFKILHNTIMDWHRRNQVRAKWFVKADRDKENYEAAPENRVNARREANGILAQVQAEEAAGALETAIGRLPARQRQALLFRSWEGMSVADTAKVMGCSQGSVKTHYHRALQALQRVSEEYLG